MIPIPSKLVHRLAICMMCLIGLMLGRTSSAKSDYETLGINTEASLKEIRSKYKTLVKQYAEVLRGGGTAEEKDSLREIIDSYAKLTKQPIHTENQTQGDQNSAELRAAYADLAHELESEFQGEDPYNNKEFLDQLVTKTFWLAVKAAEKGISGINPMSQENVREAYATLDELISNLLIPNQRYELFLNPQVGGFKSLQHANHIFDMSPRLAEEVGVKTPRDLYFRYFDMTTTPELLVKILIESDGEYLDQSFRLGPHKQSIPVETVLRDILRTMFFQDPSLPLEAVDAEVVKILLKSTSPLGKETAAQSMVQNIARKYMTGYELEAFKSPPPQPRIFQRLFGRKFNQRPFPSTPRTGIKEATNFMSYLSIDEWTRLIQDRRFGTDSLVPGMLIRTRRNQKVPEQGLEIVYRQGKARIFGFKRTCEKQLEDGLDRKHDISIE